MWIPFLLQNAHFALGLFAALVFFAIFWLYLDAWAASRSPRDSLKVAGFLLLSVSFFIHALDTEATGISQALLPPLLHLWATASTRLAGYLLIITSLSLDQLQPPSSSSLLFSAAFSPLPFLPLPALGVCLLYLRRATVGLERHLRPVFWGFLALTLFELLALATLLRSTANSDLYRLVASFSPVWIVEHLFLLASCLILGRWVMGYLLKRLLSQLFMIITCCILTIFLATTTSFTGLLLKNLEAEALRQTETDAKVLSLSLTALGQEVLTTAQLLSQNPEVAAALTTATSSASKARLASLSQNYLLTKRQSSLVITDSLGIVVARGENREKTGDPLSSHPLVKRALEGQTVSSILVIDGPLVPQISYSAALPVQSGSDLVGTILVGTIIDSAFLDGLKSATGLEASLYGGNILSSTTLLSPDGTSRPTGLKENHPTVKSQVLAKGLPYSGPTSLLNTPYLTSYLPLTDLDNSPIGLLSVSRPQSGILDTAGRSIQLTFLTTSLLLLLSIAPIFLISRFLTRQIQ